MDNHTLVSRFESYLLTERRVTENTFSAYRRDVEQLMVFLGQKNISLAAITAKDLKDFLHYLHDAHIGARSVVRKISSLKVFFSYLHERFNIVNHTQELHFPKVEKKLPQYLNEDEIKALFAVIDNDKSLHGLRNKTMLYLLYVTGMRVSELITLTVADLHFDTGFLSVHGKGGKQRMIPVPQPVLLLINEYLTGNKKILKQKGKAVAYLFPISYGGVIKPISRQAFWGILKELWKKTGSDKPISPHKLRHSFATHMLKKGADLRSLQLLLGHENLSTVQIYTHVETSYVRSIYDKKHPRS